MRFIRTPIAGAWLIEPKRVSDGRGWFARVFDATEFAANGLDPSVVQCSLSYNERRDTLRGMHYQAEPFGEPKLVRCARGAMFDVGIDLRPASPTYCQWYGVDLTAKNGLALYLCPGLAHGFQTLENDTEVIYQMGSRYVPEAVQGVRWDDRAFNISWPPSAGPRIISQRDRTLPDFRL